MCKSGTDFGFASYDHDFCEKRCNDPDQCVEPANQRRLVELLTEATEVSVRRAPGFVSASLHRSTDGTKVTMYAQWRSIDDYQAMRQDPAPLPFLQEALTIAKFEPGVYEVVRAFTPAGEPN